MISIIETPVPDISRRSPSHREEMAYLDIEYVVIPGAVNRAEQLDMFTIRPQYEKQI